MSNTYQIENVDELHDIGHTDRFRVVFRSGTDATVEYDLEQIAQNTTILYQIDLHSDLIYETDPFDGGKISAFSHLVQDIESQQDDEILEIHAPEYVYEQLTTELPDKQITQVAFGQI